ncbi:MAG: class I SAM-dependent methyltransferase [Nanoarchaeota archaeon]|nr:class I SAM-dependent methyltransferase [Nanoarchaeota archaeon]
MKCTVCKSNGVKLICKSHPGYIEGTKFDIFQCNKCDTHFIPLKKIYEKIYEKIYSNKKMPSYRRYYKYSKEIKKQKNPLRFLSDTESSYFPVYNFLKDKSCLDILEIGCGYGYLTYALNFSGHKATGVDVSKNAIKSALKNFGDFYKNSDINSFKRKNSKKFDLIIATELIEHLHNPTKFIGDCLKLLKKNGKIIITTPNKDYMRKKSFWQTDLPPVHVFWLSHESFKKLSKKHNLKLEFFDFKNYFPNNWNNLINFFISRNEKIISPVLMKNEKINPKIIKNNSLLIQKVLKFLLIDVILIRNLSNFIHNKFINEYPTLGVVLQRF